MWSVFTNHFASSFFPRESRPGHVEIESRFDPDFWFVEIEDRQGRHFLDLKDETKAS